MINFDDVTKENTRYHTLNWQQILDHAHRILETGGSGCEKINLLLNLISHQLDIDKVFLNTYDLYEEKY